MHYLFEVTAKPGYTIEQYAEACKKRRCRGACRSEPCWRLVKGSIRGNWTQNSPMIRSCKLAHLSVPFLGRGGVPAWKDMRRSLSRQPVGLRRR